MILNGEYRGQVFLSTAVVFAVNNHNHSSKFRVILNSGSQINFIAYTLLKTYKKSAFPVFGIKLNQIKAASYVEVKVKASMIKHRDKLLCYDLPNIAWELCGTKKGLTDS